jgi:hypothetical protein
MDALYFLPIKSEILQIENEWFGQIVNIGKSEYLGFLGRGHPK